MRKVYVLSAFVLLVLSAYGQFTNIANKGFASQIDDWESNRKKSFGRAEKAVDGSIKGYWKRSDQNSISMTATTGPTAWWKLEFPDSLYIDSITIWCRIDPNKGEKIDGVTIKLDGDLVGTVAYRSAKADYIFTGLQRIAKEVTVWGSPGTGVNNVSRANLELAEVQVFGGEHPNIASKGTASQVGIYKIKRTLLLRKVIMKYLLYSIAKLLSHVYMLNDPRLTRPPSAMLAEQWTETLKAPVGPSTA